MIKNQNQQIQDDSTITITLTQEQYLDLMAIIDTTTFVGKFRYRLMSLEEAIIGGVVNEKTNTNDNN